MLLLCTALTLGIVAFAADSATVKTGHEKGLTQFTLSPVPQNVESVSPVTSNFKFKEGPSKSILYEYTYIVPAGTESVTVSFESSNNQGFFVEKKNGTVSVYDFLEIKTKPADCITETTVTLENGKGSTECILPYLPSSVSGSVAKSWTLNYSKIYSFHFVAASDSTSITDDLPEKVVVSKPGDSVEPLKVAVEAPTDSEIHYVWYQGATKETTTTAIEGNNSATYTPSTANAGVTYYRAEVTVTEAGKESVTLKSATTKFVVKQENVSFSLQTYMRRELEPVGDSTQLYTLKQKLNGTVDRKMLYVSNGKLVGTIPDGLEITRIWSGSVADEELNLKREGALTTDYDTNTFTIDVTKAQGPAAAYLAENTASVTGYQHQLDAAFTYKRAMTKYIPSLWTAKAVMRLTRIICLRW